MPIFILYLFIVERASLL